MENEAEALDMRPLLLKRFVWDIFPHDYDLIAEVQSALGLVPDNEDGMDVEHGASDTRINRVAPLGNALRTLSGLSAEVVAHYVMASVEAMADEDDDVEFPEGFLEGFTNQNTEIIYDSMYAILCHLLDTGVLEYGKKVRKGDAE